MLDLTWFNTPGRYKHIEIPFASLRTAICSLITKPESMLDLQKRFHNFRFTQSSHYPFLRRSWISNEARIIPMPFLAAMKIDSSFLNLNTITRRMVRNTTSKAISAMFRNIAVHFLGFSSLRLFSTNCHGESSKLIQAKLRLSFLLQILSGYHSCALFHRKRCVAFQRYRKDLQSCKNTTWIPRLYT